MEKDERLKLIFEEAIEDLKKLEKVKVITKKEIVEIFIREKIGDSIAYAILKSLVQDFETADPTLLLSSIMGSVTALNMSEEQRQKFCDFLDKKMGEK